MTDKYILTTQSEDRIGIVAALTKVLADHGGFITAHSQFGTPGSERFYSRIAFDMEGKNIDAFRAALDGIARDMALKVEMILQALLMGIKLWYCRRVRYPASNTTMLCPRG